MRFTVPSCYRSCRAPVLAGLAALTLAASLAAQMPAMAQTQLKPGDRAPNFRLLSDQWSPVSLAQFRGKDNVVLAIYVLAFTPG